MAVIYMPPPTGVDDTRALVATMQKVVPGDMIQFREGTYKINEVTLAPGIIYRGDSSSVTPKTKIVAPSHNAFTINSSNSKFKTIISHLYFTESGTDPWTGVVSIEGSEARPVWSVVIQNCIFDKGHIQYVWMSSANIKYNSFMNVQYSGAAILGFNAKNMTIANNLFKNNWQGMSLIFANSLKDDTNVIVKSDGSKVYKQGSGIVVKNNSGSGFRRIGIELFGSDPPVNEEVVGLQVTGNFFGPWSTQLDPQGNSIAYSIVCDGGRNITISGNYANGSSGASRATMALETSGSNAYVQRNDFQYYNWGLIGYTNGAVFDYNNIFVNNPPWISAYTGVTLDVRTHNTTSGATTTITAQPAGVGASGAPAL